MSQLQFGVAIGQRHIDCASEHVNGLAHVARHRRHFASNELDRFGIHTIGVIAAGTFFVAAPLLIAFVVFQRRFVSSFTFSGIK